LQSPVDRKLVSAMPTLRRVHLWFGLAALVTFLSTGAYMRLRVPPVAELDVAQRIFFRSRHIYILAGALVHLLLGAYLSPAPGRRARIVQAVASGLIFLSVALLVAAFVVEAPAMNLEGPAGGFGLYALFAGVLLHVLAGTRRPPA
jgi:hypothetical protein